MKYDTIFWVIKLSRHARIKSKSGIFHIMLRGINRQTIFEDNEDMERFLGTIQRYKTVSKYENYGYCLMNNHIHLLLRETDEPISTAIKRISSSYVYWYNWKYNRCGHLFQERYKREAVENEAYLLTVLRYIHQNPVKAGLTKSPQEYKWSSYSEYINSEYANKTVITDTEFVLKTFSSNKKESINLFIKYTNQINEDKCLDYSERIRLTDSEVIEHYAKLGLNDIKQLQHLEKPKRNEVIRKLKTIEGVTVRQLSRITGISKSVIDRI
jgi:putative transposase